MKPQLIPILFVVFFFLVPKLSFSQIQIDPTPTAEEMVEFLVGPGVYFDNVTFLGVDQAAGIFTNGGSTNIGLEEGIFLSSGNGAIIPGPNASCVSGANNSAPGHALLNNICTDVTFDAAVLEFDFIPLNDTVRCQYVFGSEEYSEWVYSMFNDVFGFFASGPDPLGGMYTNLNIALVPATGTTPVAINNVNNGYTGCEVVPTGPGTNSEYYVDNTFGTSFEYDGFTTVLTAWLLVVPGETYHFAVGVADVADQILDSGVQLEGTSFKSPGPAEFFEFDFLTENNPSLTFDVIGTIEENNVYLEVPYGTDVTGLVASFVEQGADAYVNEIRQISGVTPNDFTEPVIYHLEGYEVADWTIYVEILTDIPEYMFNQVKIGPNPAIGEISIENIGRLFVSVYNTLGKIIHGNSRGENSLVLNDLDPGIYFIKLEKDGITEVRKVIVN